MKKWIAWCLGGWLMGCGVGGSPPASWAEFAENEEAAGVRAVWFSTEEVLRSEEALARMEVEGEHLEDGAFGFSTEFFWVLAEVCGPGDAEEPLVLDIRNPHIDRLDAWTVDADGKGLRRVARTGDALGPMDRSTPNRRPVVHLPGTAGCHQVLLCVDKRAASVSIPLEVMTAREFEAFELRVDAIHGGIFAVFFLVIALGVAAFVRFRDRRFASYSVYATARWFYMFLASGYANMTLFAGHPEWTNPLRTAVILPLAMALLWFVEDHFELARLNARLKRRNRLLMLALGFGFVVALAGQAAGWMTVPMALKGMYVLSAVCLLHLVTLAWTMRRAMRQATAYFVGAFGGSLGVAGYLILEELGVVPFVDFAVPLVLWAALVEVVVLMAGAVQLVMHRLLERQALLLQLEQVESEKMQAFVEGLEEERLRVARELHDGVGADLALISHQIQHPPTLVAALEKVIHSVRRLSSALNPTGIQRLPLDRSLRQLADSYAHVPVQLHLMLDPWPTDVPGRIEFECYRIAQEALHNAMKHAGTSQIYLSLHHDADDRSFSLTIEDDGAGFDPSGDSTGQGLSNMEYRASTIRAEWTLESAPGQGTFVSVSGRLDAAS